MRKYMVKKGMKYRRYSFLGKDPHDENEFFMDYSHVALQVSAWGLISFSVMPHWAQKIKVYSALPPVATVKPARTPESMFVYLSDAVVKNQECVHLERPTFHEVNDTGIKRNLYLVFQTD